MKNRFILLLIFIIIVVLSITILYKLSIIPHKQYTNADFNIETYISNIDKDNDGIDDQTDFYKIIDKLVKKV